VGFIDKSDKNTDPSPRKLLNEFFALVRDVRTRAGRAKKSLKILRHMGKHRLAAVRAARKEGQGEGQSRRLGVANQSALSQKIRLGLTLYRLLTDSAGKDVEGFGKPLVSYHLTPILCKRRQLIGAARRLEVEVAQGMALALEIPVDMSDKGTNQKGKIGPDEHLNLVRDYPVELHTKLVESKENRAHMSAYIHFEEDALGDDEVLGEKDMDYFIDHKDALYADPKESEGGGKRTKQEEMLREKAEGPPGGSGQENLSVGVGWLGKEGWLVG
jgi:hypothetical protein